MKATTELPLIVGLPLIGNSSIGTLSPALTAGLFRASVSPCVWCVTNGAALVLRRWRGFFCCRALCNDGAGLSANLLGVAATSSDGRCWPGKPTPFDLAPHKDRFRSLVRNPSRPLDQQ